MARRARSSAWFGLALALLACQKPPAPGSSAIQAAGGTQSLGAAGSPPVAASIAVAPSDAAGSVAGAPSDAAPVIASDEEGAHTSVSGCLASASGMPERSAPAARPNDAPAVEIVSQPKPTVVHHLTHACCLRLRTHLKRTGAVLTLSEEMSGEPCRCQCASTISTELSIPAGEYELRVETLQGGIATPAFRGNFEVGNAGTAAPAASGEHGQHRRRDST